MVGCNVTGDFPVYSGGGGAAPMIGAAIPSGAAGAAVPVPVAVSGKPVLQLLSAAIQQQVEACGDAAISQLLRTSSRAEPVVTFVDAVSQVGVFYFYFFYQLLRVHNDRLNWKYFKSNQLNISNDNDFHTYHSCPTRSQLRYFTLSPSV